MYFAWTQALKVLVGWKAGFCSYFSLRRNSDLVKPLPRATSGVQACLDAGPILQPLNEKNSAMMYDLLNVLLTSS